MNDCVYETPEASCYILNNKDLLVGPLVEVFSKKQYKKILLVGSGSSYNIALISRVAMQNILDMRVEVMYAAAYAHFDFKYHEDTLTIFLSQSGRSTNIVDAIKTAIDNKQDAVAMTMIPDSPSSKYLKNSFTYGTDKFGRDVFVCRGVPTSVLFYNLFALEAALKLKRISQDFYNKALTSIEETIKGLEDNYKKIEEFYELHKKTILNSKRVMNVGSALGYGVATEGALKIAETIGLAANAYETEEFLHGPTYEIKKDHAVFIVDLDEKVHERHLNIYYAVKELTDKVYIVTRFDDLVGDNVLRLETNNYENILPMVFVVLFQLISSNICEEFGIQAVTIYNKRVSEIVQTKTD